MKKIELLSADIGENIRCIQEALGGKIEEDCDILNLKLAKKAGEGNIKGANFLNGLGLITFHCTLANKVQLVYNPDKVSPIRFIFCVRGSFSHFMADNASEYKLESLKGSITAELEETSQTLVLPAGTPLTINVLEVIREVYIDRIDCNLKTLPSPLPSIFRGTYKKPVFIYTGNYSLSIAEIIEEINVNNLTGLPLRTYLESKALELFTQQMQQYEDDRKSGKKRQILRKAEVELIIKAKEILLGNLQNPPTIAALARQTGLNEQKLKKGFKLLQGTTINKFLLNERMELAKILLAEGNKSIKEITAIVGFANPGYFTSRFKEKFGVLPRDFLKALKQQQKKASLEVEKAVA